MIDICLLGTGGMMPLPERWLSSLLIRYNGNMVLIDCGEGTQIPLKLAQWGFKSIDAILLTHYHADHVAGLPGLLLTIGNSGREEPLTIMGPKGLERVIRGITVIAPELPYDLNIIELSSQESGDINIDGLIIKCIPVDHNISCLSYSVELKRPGRFDAGRAKSQNIPVSFWSRLQNGETINSDGVLYTPDMVLGEPRKGLKISYCTDTRPVPGIPEFIKGSDVFVCEGMYGDEEFFPKAVQKKHMMIREAAELSRLGDVKELWLTHFSPSMTMPEQFLEAACGIFKNTIVGSGLIKKTLVFED